MQEADKNLSARIVLPELLRSCIGKYFSCSKVGLRCKKAYSPPAPWQGMAAGSMWELLYASLIM